MKRIIIIIIVFVITMNLNAQTRILKYQGSLSDNLNNRISQSGLIMKFAIYDAESFGTKLWPLATDYITKQVDVVKGLYTVKLGTGIDDDITFADSMLLGKSLYLEVKIGTSILPRTLINNVPFSLFSSKSLQAKHISGGSEGSIPFQAVSGRTELLLKGTNGQVLTVENGIPTWKTPTGIATDVSYEGDITLQTTANNGNILISPNGSGAVGINSSGIFPNSSSILDISDSTRGILLPRMTEEERKAIISPAEGLLVYQTDGNKGLYCNLAYGADPLWKRIKNEEQPIHNTFSGGFLNKTKYNQINNNDGVIDTEIVNSMILIVPNSDTLSFNSNYFYTLQTSQGNVCSPYLPRQYKIFKIFNRNREPLDLSYWIYIQEYREGNLFCSIQLSPDIPVFAFTNGIREIFTLINESTISIEAYSDAQEITIMK